MKDDKKVLNAFALVGFILGLLSVALYWVLGIVPVLAIIFSIIGLVSVKKLGQKGKGFAITGLVLGIIFILAFGLQIFLRYNNYFQTENIQENIAQENTVQENGNLLDLLQGDWESSITILDTTTYHKLTITNTFINVKRYSLNSGIENSNSGYITLLDNENFTITFDTGITQDFRYDRNLNTIMAENGTDMIYTKVK